MRVFALGPVLPLRWDGAGLSVALSSCRLSRDRLNLRRQETEEADRAYDVSKDIMQNSSSTYLEVLAALKSILNKCLTIKNKILMKKKQKKYERPSVKVVELQHRTQVLTGSPGGLIIPDEYPTQPSPFIF